MSGVLRWARNSCFYRGSRVERFLDREDKEPSKKERRARSLARQEVPMRAQESIDSEEAQGPSKRKQRARSLARISRKTRASATEVFLDEATFTPCLPGGVA
eukprot:CAMPEP_0175750110 /NCGR_PEP_ID=MMETSP0097-20121207/60505_1 /TAXON_ID=311494 /ORGANISM="Alexandrium monilatum, Strain CCMP3105" /LENGTH=101 /DNA_ID=CAMNT_0017058703 /DNA_START=35 /DNA_END=340 /DNA_ORIENTATION=+